MRLATISAFAGLFVAFLAADASAFCRSSTCRDTATKECKTDEDGCPAEGSKLYWPTSCVSYAVNRLGTQDLDPEDSRAIIRKAFQSWSDVPCPSGGSAKMTFEERDPVSCKKSEYNKTGSNLNVVLFQDDDWKYRGIDGTLAKTSVTFNDDTGEIYDADIEINAANNTLTITDDLAKVDFDLQSVVTHEAGHFIGIAHSSETSAVMYSTYPEGSLALRTLTPDDVDAVCAIYPPNSDAACNFDPRGGFSESCDGPTGNKSTCAISTAASNVSGRNASSGLWILGFGIILVCGRAMRRARGSGTT